MPYKVEGTKVMVKKGGLWRMLKNHKTAEEAEAHRKALEANVPEAKENKNG